MSRWKRYLGFVILNILISALTMYLVLFFAMKSNPTGLLGDFSFGTSSSPLDIFPTQAISQPSEAAFVGGLVEGLDISRVVGAGDISVEYVQIHYGGDIELLLAGWQLQDQDGNQLIFPGLRIFPGGSIKIYSQRGTDSSSEIFWNRDAAIWESGELVSLVDPDGQVQVEYQVP